MGGLIELVLLAGFLNPIPANDSFALLTAEDAEWGFASPKCFKTPCSRKSPNRFIIASFISSLII